MAEPKFKVGEKVSMHRWDDSNARSVISRRIFPHVGSPAEVLLIERADTACASGWLYFVRGTESVVEVDEGWLDKLEQA